MKKKGFDSMLDSVSKIYQARSLDMVTPVTKKTFETKQVQNELYTAQVMIHLQQLAEKVGIELVSGEELEQTAVEVVLADRKAIKIESEMISYERREEAYKENSFLEKVRRFGGNSNMNPLIKYGQMAPAPQHSVVVESNNESLISMFNEMQKQSAENNQNMMNSMLKMTETFTQAMQTGMPSAEEALGE